MRGIAGLIEKYIALITLVIFLLWLGLLNIENYNRWILLCYFLTSSMLIGGIIANYNNLVGYLEKSNIISKKETILGVLAYGALFIALIWAFFEFAPKEKDKEYSALSNQNFERQNFAHSSSDEFNGTGVFICQSPNAYAYHSDSDCERLNNCSYDVVEASEDEAVDAGREPCSQCN